MVNMSVIVNYTDCQRKEGEFIPRCFHSFFSSTVLLLNGPKLNFALFFLCAVRHLRHGAHPGREVALSGLSAGQLGRFLLQLFQHVRAPSSVFIWESARNRAGEWDWIKCWCMVDRKNDHLNKIFFSYCNNFSDLRLVIFLKIWVKNFVVNFILH